MKIFPSDQAKAKSKAEAVTVPRAGILTKGTPSASSTAFCQRLPSLTIRVGRAAHCEGSAALMLAAM
jgi:hypothetical protein